MSETPRKSNNFDHIREMVYGSYGEDAPLHELKEAQPAKHAESMIDLESEPTVGALWDQQEAEVQTEVERQQAEARTREEVLKTTMESMSDQALREYLSSISMAEVAARNHARHQTDFTLAA